jgi:hypothetical protein
MPRVSAGFVATGIHSLAAIMGMHFSTPDCDGSTSDDLSVGVGFVGVTGSDMDLQDKKESAYETATETAGSHIDIAINVSPEGFRFGPSWAADFAVLNHVFSPSSRPDFSAFFSYLNRCSLLRSSY